MDPKWIKPPKFGVSVRIRIRHSTILVHPMLIIFNWSLLTSLICNSLLFHRSKCPGSIVGWYSIGVYLVIRFVMDFSPFWVSLTVDCETGEQSTLTVFVCHLQSSIFKCMKCSQWPAKSNHHRGGWTGEIYQETNSDNGPEPCHHPKDPHHRQCYTC